LTAPSIHHRSALQFSLKPTVGVRWSEGLRLEDRETS
jgi:hypothetical protein